MAASQGAAEVMYIRGLLLEMGVDITAPTTVYVDNSGAVELSKDLKSCNRSLHIERRYLWVRELVHQGQIIVKYCPTDENVADAMTKPLPAATFERHSSAMFNMPISLDAPAPIARHRRAPAIRQRTFDVEAAYLKGKFDDSEILYARPPPGYRSYDRDVMYVWRLLVPLYGEADAGRIWNRTLVRQLVRVQNFTQSEYDPCFFWKHLSDGTRMNIVMYVDDGYVTDSNSSIADAELEQLNAAFTITLKNAHFFLGNNIVVDDAQGDAP